MPLLKSPSTLFNLALAQTRLWLWEAAYMIYKEFGNYDQVQCQYEVLRLNNFLISNVHSHIIDELYNSCAQVLEKPHLQKNEIALETLKIFDVRIVLSLYINVNMRVLNTHKLLYNKFWERTLLPLKNLTRLDLRKVCTDEILEIVGENCVNIEFINITSRLCHARARFRHNALKLQLCVSDAGLSFLANCKQLREIQMTSIIRKGCGGRQITNEGIQKLLLSLPKLQRINYTDTGILIDSIPGKLALVSLIDSHPCAERIPKMESSCPYLTELHLKYAYSSSDCIIYDVFSALSTSKLNISNLSLTNFSLDDFLKLYLETKGEHLKVLNFVSGLLTSAGINDFFFLLGSSCPQLEHLDVSFHSSCPKDEPFKLSFVSNKSLFPNLKTLIVGGINWDLNRTLPILLKNAVYIKKLLLKNEPYYQCIDDTLQQIQQTNPFKYLEAVYFSKRANISVPFLRTFILSCPLLKDICVECESTDYLEQVFYLRQELLNQNLDVSFHCLEM